MKKAIIWGHKLNTHTQSYVHNGYYRAFKYMGYDTYWFDDKDDVSNFDFSNCIFFTEGQVDNKIPLRKDCRYIIHWCSDKYLDYNYVKLWVFNDKVQGEKLNDYTYINGREIYQPWATDLLPPEIVSVVTPKENTINYVGTVGRGEEGSCSGFARAAKTMNINFKIYGGYSSTVASPFLSVQSGFVDNELAIDLIRKSYVAPAFQADLQVQTKYIPCRIFKNISYGQLGISNNPGLTNFFEEEIICNSNTYDLFFEVEAKKDKQQLHKLMQVIKEKHTFINRIEPIEKMFSSF